MPREVGKLRISFHPSLGNPVEHLNDPVGKPPQETPRRESAVSGEPRFAPFSTPKPLEDLIGCLLYQMTVGTPLLSPFRNHRPNLRRLFGSDGLNCPLSPLRERGRYDPHHRKIIGNVVGRLGKGFPFL